MSYHSSFDKFNYNQYPKCVGLTDEERENFISQVRHDNGGFRTVQILETITNIPGYFDYNHACDLYQNPQNSIAVGIAHVEYTGKGSDASGHAVVVVKDTITNEYHIINFNSHWIQNTGASQDRYITGGPLLKRRRSRQNVPDISVTNYLVTQNLQDGAPICTLIAAANFKTIFEQCRTMDNVRARFTGQELLQRLEDVKTLFGNRVIHGGYNQGKTVAEHVESKIQSFRRRLSVGFDTEINHPVETQSTAMVTTEKKQAQAQQRKQACRLPALYALKGTRVVSANQHNNFLL